MPVLPPPPGCCERDLSGMYVDMWVWHGGGGEGREKEEVRRGGEGRKEGKSRGGGEGKTV